MESRAHQSWTKIRRKNKIKSPTTRCFRGAGYPILHARELLLQFKRCRNPTNDPAPDSSDHSVAQYVRLCEKICRGFQNWATVVSDIDGGGVGCGGKCTNPQKLTARMCDGRVWRENWALTAGVRVPKFCCCHGVIARG